MQTFLYEEIIEVIYMQEPIGFEQASNVEKVCRLKKAIYGLKQSSKVWNKTFGDFMIKYALNPTSANLCIFVTTTDSKMIVSLFIDNGVSCSPDKIRIEGLMTEI